MTTTCVDVVTYTHSNSSKIISTRRCYLSERMGIELDLRIDSRYGQVTGRRASFEKGGRKVRCTSYSYQSELFWRKGSAFSICSKEFDRRAWEQKGFVAMGFGPNLN